MELQLTGTKAGGGAGASSGGSTSAPTKAGLDIGAAAFMLKEQADTRAKLAAAAAGQPPMLPRPPGEPSWHSPELKAALRESAPSWWPMPESFASAAEAFDQRHQTRSSRAERLLTQLIVDKTSESKKAAVEDAYYEVFTNRFVDPVLTVDDPYCPPGRNSLRDYREHGHPLPQPPFEGNFPLPPTSGDVWIPYRGELLAKPTRLPPKPKGEFQIKESVWGARSAWSDSKDFFDTPEVKNLKMEADFGRALAGGLGRFILQYDDDEGAGKDAAKKASAAELAANAEVVEVRQVLCKYHDVYFTLFDVYAALGGGDSMHEMSINEFGEFVRDFQLADKKSKYCRKEDLDRLFIAVDASSAGSGGESKDKALSRTEFLICLVRMAVFKYVLPGATSDVSEAVEKLFVLHRTPVLDPAVFADPNAFRREHLYHPEVAGVLMQHEPSLRMIFNCMAVVPRSAKKLGAIIGLGEWKALMRRLQLVDYDLTERDAALCFICSRMAVIDGASDKGMIKESCLPFEGFIEALSRAALLKGWPDADEVAHSTHADAGAYVRYLRAMEPANHQTMCETRAAAWGSEPLLPVVQCVENLILLMLHTIAQQVHGDDSRRNRRGVEMTLTIKDANSWNALFKRGAGDL